MGVPVQKLAQRTKDLHEFNPMLGHRGCRLAITYPEIYAMQVRAILEAARRSSPTEGGDVHPEIMIPLAMTQRELERMRAIVDAGGRARSSPRRGKTCRRSRSAR